MTMGQSNDDHRVTQDTTVLYWLVAIPSLLSHLALSLTRVTWILTSIDWLTSTIPSDLNTLRAYITPSVYQIPLHNILLDYRLQFQQTKHHECYPGPDAADKAAAKDQGLFWLAPEIQNY